MSLDRRQFFQINTLNPLLQFARFLVLQLDLDKITIRNHHPKGGVFAFFLKRFKTGVAIDGDSFAVTFAAFAIVIPCSCGGTDIIRISNRIEYANRRGRRFVPFAFVIIPMDVCDSEATDVFG